MKKADANHKDLACSDASLSEKPYDRLLSQLEIAAKMFGGGE